MPLLSTATKVYTGATPAVKVYQGASLAWSAVWTPASIPGLVTWMDPAQDTFTEGQLVSAYPDHSPAHLTLTARAGEEPVFRGGTRPHLDFAKSGLSYTTGITAPDGATVFVVCIRDPVLSEGYSMVASVGGDDNYDQRFAGVSTMQYVVDYNFTFRTEYNPIPVTDDSPHAFALRVEAATGASSGYIDGVLHQFNVANTPRHTWPSPVHIGRRVDQNFRYTGTMYEALVYNRVLSDTEVATVHDYLTAKHLTWTPLWIPGLVTWIDPAQDLFADGERVGTYVEHANGLAFTADPRPEYQPIFRAGGYPYLDFPSQCFGYTSAVQRPWVNGMTFISVNAVMGGSYPMMVVVGPDANGIEMRHDGSAQQLVIMYSSYGIVFSHPTVGAHSKMLYALRVQPGAATAAWTGSVKATGGAPGAMDSAPQTMWVGRRQGGYYFVGPMYETLIYDGPVSDTDLALLRDHLNTKHGIPA